MTLASTPAANGIFSTSHSAAANAKLRPGSRSSSRSVGRGAYVEPSKATVVEFVRARVAQWEAAGNISARTAQRYRQLVENQIAPHIGNKALQKLTRLDLEAMAHDATQWRARAPQYRPCTSRSVQGLGDAESDGAVVRNVCKLQRAPKVAESEKAIVQDVPAFVDKIRGERLYVPAIVALFTGMRLGEILALRERALTSTACVIEVREALEETRRKEMYSRRRNQRPAAATSPCPISLVEALREHRRQQLELRMKLGLGKPEPDALLFANLEGGPLRPSTVSSDWGDLAERIGMPEITFHGLRHTHA